MGVKVDPIDLYLSGSRTNQHAADLLAAHTSANSRAAEAHTGWVGASGAALTGLVESWHEFTTGIHSTMTQHGDHFTSSGHHYAATDTATARTIAEAGADTTSLNLG